VRTWRVAEAELVECSRAIDQTGAVRLGCIQLQKKQERRFLKRTLCNCECHSDPILWAHWETMFPKMTDGQKICSLKFYQIRRWGCGTCLVCRRPRVQPLSAAISKN
jgi:hypothetical protein